MISKPRKRCFFDTCRQLTYTPRKPEAVKVGHVSVKIYSRDRLHKAVGKTYRVWEVADYSTGVHRFNEGVPHPLALRSRAESPAVGGRDPPNDFASRDCFQTPRARRAARRQLGGHRRVRSRRRPGQRDFFRAAPLRDRHSPCAGQWCVCRLGRNSHRGEARETCAARRSPVTLLQRTPEYSIVTIPLTTRTLRIIGRNESARSR